ncbi:hypothetical protein, partial [Mesorhizobium sp. Cs1321R2N1]|uniref:hypothetical protein n=1 Tax=Mesorhizobium sp. Cs1321R2N1 TaxID=3015174 RepID=UPI00301D3049
MADGDGDGLDSVNANGSGAFGLGTGDFLGNGHQQPFFSGSGGTIRKATLSNGTWQPSGASFAIGCPWTSYSGDGTCVVADINGDGASDIFRFDGVYDIIGLWLSTGSGFKSYTVSPMAGTSAVVRDFDNSGKASVIT